MSYRIIGTCGNCGGPVGVPTLWLGIYPPTPQCLSCHAIPKEAHGKVLPMQPSPDRGGGWVREERKGHLRSTTWASGPVDLRAILR